MLAARRTWETACSTISRSAKGWQDKVKIRQEFGPQLDTMDKLDADFQGKVRALNADIIRLQNLMKEINNTRIERILTTQEAAQALSRQDRDNLLAAEAGALRKANELITTSLAEPLREFLEVLKYRIGE